MGREEIKKAVQNALNDLASGMLTEKAVRLFEVLGYNTERQAPFVNPSFNEFRDSYVDGNARFSEEKAIVSDWNYVDLLFQLSGEEIKKQTSLFDVKKVVTSGDSKIAMESYLFFAIGLSGPKYTRTALSRITREINKLFPMPVMVLFKCGGTITLAVINRRLNKRDERKDVLEKVTLIKDININNPHRAHVEVLFDLSFSELLRKHKFTNFIDLHNAWRKTLDIKELNKRFYQELANWYFWAMDHVRFPDDVEKDRPILNATSLIRLITRVIFIWFIKEKGLVPEALFDKNELARVLKAFAKDDNSHGYYHAILQNLFFGTLNQKMDERGFAREGSFQENKNNYGIKNLFRYANNFAVSEKEALDLFKDIPFLNGGLFDCLDKEDEQGKVLYTDGFSRNARKQAIIPDFLFFGAEREYDLNAVYGTKNKGYKTKGLIEILSGYKFTVAENTPVEEEVALDPELLGKVFENLLASYNPETQTTARKQTGSFYTPREIVNYMVDESLKAYLKQVLSDNLNIKAEDARAGLDILFSYTEREHALTPDETRALIQAIDSCKILDPACGSGAFPMGILHKLVHILHKLDPKNEQWKERQIQKARRIDDPAIRDHLIADIESAFENNELDYGRKLFLIENCIFGVDIQPIAVQIAKLRFFISLVVDQNKQPDKENLGIRSLPNLETKFVAANTLIELEKPDQQMNLFANKEVIDLEEKLKELRHQYFSAKNRKKKIACQKEDKTLRQKIAGLLMNDGWAQESAKQIVAFDPYDQNAGSPFFDPGWMFGITEGFDIVIGNPPYLRIQGVQETNPELIPYAKKHFKSAAKGNWDLYVLFTEKGFGLLRPHGILAFIQPHKFFQAEFGAAIRNYISKSKGIYLIVHFGAEQMFESATNYTCLFFLQKQPRRNFTYIPVPQAEEWLRDTGSVEAVILPQPKEGQKWTFTNREKLGLLEKLKQQPQTLGDMTRKIFQGIATSADRIYVLLLKDRRKDAVLAFSNSLQREIEIESGLVKPFLMGKDVKRYEKPEPRNVVIFPYLLENGKGFLMQPEYIRKNFPLGWKYLSENRTELENRENGRMKHADFYAYIYPKNLTEFAAVKIMTPDIASKPQFALDTFSNYHTTTIYSFSFKNEVVEAHDYLLGIFNSRLMWLFLQTTGNVLRGGFIRFKTEYLKPFPVRRIDFTNPADKKAHDKICQLVSVIIQGKQSGKETFKQEASIDAMAFHLYGFSEQEMLDALLQMPDVSEAERREIQAQYRNIALRGV
jgi:type I restriction-modification system DNA methylase subunit